MALIYTVCIIGVKPRAEIGMPMGQVIPCATANAARAFSDLPRPRHAETTGPTFPSSKLKKGSFEFDDNPGNQRTEHGGCSLVPATRCATRVKMTEIPSAVVL